jgi:hypothetical protein
MKLGIKCNFCECRFCGLYNNGMGIPKSHFAFCLTMVSNESLEIEIQNFV